MEDSSERPDAARRVHPLLLALSLLTLVTGLVDAACYLGLGRVFTANMTGNVVLLAFGAAGAQELPVLAPTVSHFVAGENRLGFGLFTTARAQIADATAAVYIAPVGGGEAEGPFVAHYHSLAVKPAFLSETTDNDPDAAKTLYVADVPFKKPGRY